MQPFKYSGKEIETRHGIGWYDFGARRYDHDVARWTTMDPLSEKYYSVSPYAFCNNNPVNFVDPDGKRWVNKIKLVNAPFDVTVNIYHHEPPPNRPYGEFAYSGIKYDKEAQRYVPKFSGTSITIYSKMAEERSKRLGISLSEAWAVNFGHEIEHSTTENFELKHMLKHDKTLDKEEAPNQISKDMISEFVSLNMLKNLKYTQLLPVPLIQSKETGIKKEE